MSWGEGLCWLSKAPALVLQGQRSSSASLEGVSEVCLELHLNQRCVVGVAVLEGL